MCECAYESVCECAYESVCECAYESVCECDYESVCVLGYVFILFFHIYSHSLNENNLVNTIFWYISKVFGPKC